jgi:hypothetical protein
MIKIHKLVKIKKNLLKFLKLTWNLQPLVMKSKKQMTKFLKISWKTLKNLIVNIKI